jgi:hypothetical protein
VTKGGRVRTVTGLRPPRTTIREVRDPRDPLVREAYALLRRTFARGERVAMREWVESLRENAGKLPTDFSWHLFVAEQEGVVVGLASGTYLGNVNIGVVGYLAMHPIVRSRGIGSRLRLRLRRQFARDAQRLGHRALDGIVGEVSPANPWLRRLASRPEVLVLDFPYFQPRLYDGDDPTPFLLYYESLASPRTRMPVGELRRILYTIWRRIYRVARPLDQPPFRAMMRALDGRRSVGRRRLTPGPS